MKRKEYVYKKKKLLHLIQSIQILLSQEVSNAIELEKIDLVALVLLDIFWFEIVDNFLKCHSVIGEMIVYQIISLELLLESCDHIKTEQLSSGFILVPKVNCPLSRISHTRRLTKQLVDLA